MENSKKDSIKINIEVDMQNFPLKMFFPIYKQFYSR